MEYKLDNAELTATLTAVNLNTAVVGQAPLEVTIGESARLDVGVAINYIESGKAELQPLVNEAAASAEAAAVSELNAMNSANNAQEYAQRAENAKDEAEQILENCVTQPELEAALLEKQDVISDLSEIRDGATLGATAVQPSDLESYATKDYVDNGLSGKQDTLTAGANIQIVGNTISAVDTTYTAGTGISIVGNVISNTQTSAEWGNITGTLSAQTDIWNILEEKANTADIPTATSDLLNDSGFITLSALTPYATQTWVSQQGYITNAALVDYATESYVTTAVGTETTNRQNADNNLQSQIDAITASSDVTDIVGTYAELQNYDTSALAPNSIVKVLQDESRNNETTYYRWVITGGVGAWSLIGEEGPYYTISAADAKFVTQTALSTGLAAKQDTISDLATIRSGAALGATAVQPSDLATVATTGSYNDLSNKPTNVSAFTNDAGYITAAALTGYATESYVTTATANMQTTGNLVTSISSTSTNEQYPSAKCVYDIVGDVETLINAL